jgi:hypothetical protein
MVFPKRELKSDLLHVFFPIDFFSCLKKTLILLSISHSSTVASCNYLSLYLSLSFCCIQHNARSHLDTLSYLPYSCTTKKDMRYVKHEQIIIYTKQYLKRRTTKKSLSPYNHFRSPRYLLPHAPFATTISSCILVRSPSLPLFLPPS